MIRAALCTGGLVALTTAALADPSLECSVTASSQVEIGNCLAVVEENLIPTLAIALDGARASAQELDDITERSVAVPALDASQAAWEAYKDAQCDYAGSLFGGGSAVILNSQQADIGFKTGSQQVVFTQFCTELM